jgi:hypothetical protein
MPPTGWSSYASALAVLVRRKKLLKSDWCAILEARRRRLKSELPGMTLATLDRLVYGEWPVKTTAQLASDQLNWRFDGIIGTPNWIDDGPHTRKTWMLTRKCEWVWVVLGLDPQELWKPDVERRVLEVDVLPASPEMFAEAGFDLERIWRSTAVVILSHRDRCQMRLNNAEGLARQIEAEEAMVSAWGVAQDQVRTTR